MSFIIFTLWRGFTLVYEFFNSVMSSSKIVDIETKEFLFYINATKDSGNWMRHIKCARFFEEQNIVSEQDGIDIFYQAIKVLHLSLSLVLKA